MNQNLTFKLSDGRRLGYAEYGDSAGHPVLYCHGFPGSRLQGSDFHSTAQAKSCRLLGVDRPGMGYSDFKGKYTLLSWTKDIEELADYLGLDQFSIIAHSGGAPFALACAYAMPRRITHVAIVSGLGPTTLAGSNKGMAVGMRIINGLVRRVPGFSWLLMQMQNRVLLKPEVFKRVIEKVPAVDQPICSKFNISILKEAFRHGVKGAAYEFRLILKAWGFKLEDVPVPVSIWYGLLGRVIN